jgi:hypothetical protein
MLYFARKPKVFGLSHAATTQVSALFDDVMDLTEVYNAIDTRRAAVLSAWDVALLARRGRHVNREGDDLEDGADILAPIRRLALNHRLHMFARRLVAELAPGDLWRLDARIHHWSVSRDFAPRGGVRPLAELVQALPRWS